MPTFRGIGCHFGAGSTTLSTVTGQVQTRDYTKKADKFSIEDGNAELAGAVYYNATEEATFSYIPTQATLNGNMNPTLPAVGALITLTDSIFTPVAGSTWTVEEVSTKSANNQAMRVDLKIMRASGIAS